MSRTRIFLSSTCYDLRALREHLREKIEEFGHELLASEHSSFPITPDLSTVENCKKVVRDHADLFVLIVGGKRGSLDSSGVRSVVNAEYLEARARGLDAFIFVDKQVWDLLPIYQKNPDADFSPPVDYPEVFKFVAELKSESRWIYTFSRTEEIITTLRTQLSVFLKVLIERGRAGSLIVPSEFASDSRQVIAIIQERPKFWEYLLTAELLEQAVANGRRRMDSLRDGLVYLPVEYIREQGDTMGRIQKLFADIKNLIESLVMALNQIAPSFGPPGVAGNPVEIRTACNRISELIDACVDWETELRFIKAPDKFMPLFMSLKDSTLEIIEQLARIAPRLRNGVEEAKKSTGPYTIEIQLKLESPPTLKLFNEEMNKLKGGFRLW